MSITTEYFEQAIARLAGELGPALGRAGEKRLAAMLEAAVPDVETRNIVAGLTAAAAAKALAAGAEPQALAAGIHEACRILVDRQIEHEQLLQALAADSDAPGAAGFHAAVAGCFYLELAAAEARERDAIDKLCASLPCDRQQAEAVVASETEGGVLSPRATAFAATMNALYACGERAAATQATALRLIDAEEEDRHRISRDLHDSAAQSLAVARLQLEIAENSAEGAQLAEARTQVERAILDVRRLISELSPVTLERMGVAAAARQIVNRFRQAYEIPVSLEIGDIPPVSRRIALVISRTLQDCLLKIGEDSLAASLNVLISDTDGTLEMEILFQRGRKRAGSHMPADQWGIRDRIALLGGEVSIEYARERGRAAAGTFAPLKKIRVKVPIEG